MNKIYIPLINSEEKGMFKDEKYKKYFLIAVSSFFITYKMGIFDSAIKYFSNEEYLPCNERFMKWWSLEKKEDKKINIKEELKMISTYR